jgi:hypothetical protein
VTHHVFRGEAHVKWSFRRLTTRNLGTNSGDTGGDEDTPAQQDAFAPEEPEPSVPPIGMSPPLGDDPSN